LQHFKVADRGDDEEAAASCFAAKLARRLTDHRVGRGQNRDGDAHGRSRYENVTWTNEIGAPRATLPRARRAAGGSTLIIGEGIQALPICLRTGMAAAIAADFIASRAGR
jgi:hypothetical protein